MRAFPDGRPPGIHIWTLAWHGVPESTWTSAAALLDDAERAHAARFVALRHQRARLAGHALKRLMLEAFTGVPAEFWRFTTGPHGKPRVTGSDGPHFSLSYYEDCVVCAMSGDAELGVDIARVGRAPLLDLAEAYCTPNERAWLQSLPQSSQQEGFLRLWTLKEALTKATGSGLSQCFRSTVFGFDPLRVTFHDLALGDSASWRFAQRVLGGTTILAVAWRGNPGHCCAVVEEKRLDRLIGARPRRTDALTPVACDHITQPS